MESKNTSSSSADEFVGRKNAKPSATTSSSSSFRPGYFSTVIPPPSAVIAKDLSHSDLCWTLNKQRGEGSSIASARCANAAGSQSHGSPSRRQITQNKEGKPVYPSESIESPCFGSSVHYGARDFYTSSSSTHTSGTWKNFITDEGNDLGNPHAADRGEWWQGSLYY